MFDISNLPVFYLISSAVALIILLLLIKYISGRSLSAIPEQHTYIVVNQHGFKRVLKKPEFLWNPLEWVLKGPHLSRFAYQISPNVDTEVKDNIKHLINPVTGWVDLRVQHFTCPDFQIETADLNTMTVTVGITFRLEPDRLKETIILGNFERMLQDNLENAFREELGKLDNEDIGHHISDLREKVLYLLKERESKRWSLGVEFINVAFRVSKSAETRTSEAVTTTDGQPFRHSVSHVDEQKLDAIRDTFLRKGWKDGTVGDIEAMNEHYKAANDALLKIMEFQMRQNIVEALVGSGSVMVLSTNDVGLRDDQMLREPLKDFVTQNKPAKDMNSRSPKEAAEHDKV